MLRITRTDEQGNVIRLRIDGTVDGDFLSHIEASYSAGKSSEDYLLLLDMSGVDFMTEAAARQLALLRSERLRIVNCSPFIETLLRVCQA
jgi:anti-anti-sigma regulatory factor